ncbi:MAG: hypothetical protein KF884_03380 [Fimbriimonadaceae bacterium]|nr:hypothetical protein [Fimbriimonadaceae bacterium]QYK59133.1 MAG: hypothetical protein KF884_03380 [Fimbriimonadaceae bacterium]
MPAIFDASPLINLAGSRRAREILQLLPHPLMVPKEVEADLHRGVAKGHAQAHVFDELRADGFVQIIEMGEVARGIFETLVTGSAQDTLDDGEAATIACALEYEGIAIIDEAKALRICSSSFPLLEVTSTCHLLLHEHVEQILGREALCDCLFNALQISRMRVPKKYLDEVVQLLGADRANLCNSLPKAVRL